MSMRTALMEMAKPKKERAAWVPESIADEQVEAFMEATVAAIAEGVDTFVFEGKHYKAKTKKEDKLDPVGQEDDDIDNDGDVDSSDKYLKKRRSAIAKRRAMDEEKLEENYTDKQDASYRDEPTPKGAQKRLKALHKKALAYRKKHGKFPSDPYSAAKKSKVDLKFESTETIDEAMSGTYMTVEYDYSDNFGMLELYKNGKKIGSWDGYPSSESGKNYLAIEATKLAKKHGVNPNGLKTVDGEDPKRTGKLVPNKDFGFPKGKAKRESVEESSGTAQHGTDSKTTETFDNMMNNGSGDIPMGKMKDFVNQHELEVGLDAEKIYQQNKYEALSKTPARMGDQSKGDKKPVNPIKVDMVDGMRKALAQMKLSGE